MSKMEKWMLAAVLICGTTILASCSDNADNSVKPGSEKVVDTATRTTGCGSPK